MKATFSALDKSNMSEQNPDRIEFKLPKMGESITEGTILSWNFQEGEVFNENDILLEVGTDKVDNEVPAPFSGRLIQINVQPNEVIKIGEVIAIIEVVDVSVTNEVANSITKQESSEKRTPLSPSIENKVQQKRDKSVIASNQYVNITDSNGIKRGENRFFSPLVEQIAKENHISYEELARIPATGADGRLKKKDIYEYLTAGRPFQFIQTVVEKEVGFKVPELNLDKGKGKLVEMDRMRQMIADHMVFSKHTSPHVTAYVEADLTEMVAWRNKNKDSFQQETGEKLTFTPLFIQAVTRAIQDFPMINSSLDGKNIIVKEEINIGMATALPSGNLIVPVVRNADKKDLASLAKEVNILATKARVNKLSSDDTKGSTFTISNVGTFGSLMGTPIINQPEAAILATGIIKKRAEVIEYEEGDKIEIRHMMYLSLSFDHRIVDGFLAGSFLRRIADYMEEKR